MGNLVMKRTMDYYKLVPLFIKSGLEIHEEDPVPEGLVTCFELVDEETEELINVEVSYALFAFRYVCKCGELVWGRLTGNR